MAGLREGESITEVVKKRTSHAASWKKHSCGLLNSHRVVRVRLRVYLG